jgi:multidrug efflux pump subunit AcrB
MNPTEPAGVPRSTEVSPPPRDGFSEFFVRRWQLSLVLFGMLIAVGVNAWLAIPRSEDPIFPIPGFTVIAVYPGATPADIEQFVADPIEERLAELDRVSEIRTLVGDGVATVRIEFFANENADRRYDEVVREVNALRPTLPADVLSVTVERFSSAEVNIVQLALVSATAPYHEMKAAADRLKDRIRTVPGVRTAQVWAAPDRQVRVSLDMGRLAELRIPPTQVLAAIGGDAANIPGGSVDVGQRRFNVKTSGDFQSLDEVRNTVVRAAAGEAVFLRDVAEVEWGYADPTHLGRFNGERAVFVTANQQDGTNISRVRDGIWREADAWEATLPASITLERGFDQSANVSRRLATLGRDFAIALGLVLITLLPLGLRASGIVMVSIPLSMAMGLAGLHAIGFSINQLSIVGLVIALGLLVDDSIVVVENISRFLREGHSRLQAAILATRQITVAVIGSTAVLVLAFVPLIFLPGIPGKFIRVLPVTVVLTVMASLLVALTIIPWLASRVMRPGDDVEGNRAMRLLTRVINASYVPLLRRSLRRPLPTLAAAGALVIGSVALVPAVGFSLFPKAGTPQFRIDVTTPTGSSLDETDRAVRFVEGVLRERPEVRGVFANAGRDNPQIYYNVIPRSENPSAGQLFVLLDRYDRGTPALLDTLRARLAGYPNARIEIKEFENGPPIAAPIEMRVEGPDLDTLRALAARVEQTMEGTPGTLYVNNPVRLLRTDLQVAVDRSKAGLFGIPTVEVDRTVRMGIAGLQAGRFRDGAGDEFDIQVRLAHDGRPDAGALDRVYVASMAGAQVPLWQVADLRFAASVPRIERKDRQRSVTVTSFVQNGFVTDRVTRDVLARLDEIPLPAGYRVVAAGEIESREESFGGIGGAVIVAVFLILAILVLEFRTFRSTLIVASVIPLGFVGGIVALLLTGYTLSFTALIGFVALIGLGIKTSLLLVDFANQLREQGAPLDEAIQHAAEVRFVPIVLTALTAVGGLLPLALQGSSLYSPLAWVMIGGLISSTVLGQLVTPVVYRWLAPAVEPAA